MDDITNTNKYLKYFIRYCTFHGNAEIVVFIMPRLYMTVRCELSVIIFFTGT